MRSLLSVLSLHIWIKQEWVPSDQGKLALRLKSFTLSSPSEISVVISFSSCLLWVSWLQTVSGSSSCVQCWRIGLNALNMVIYQTAAECLTAFLHIFKAECLTSAVLCILWQTMSLKQIEEQDSISDCGGEAVSADVSWYDRNASRYHNWITIEPVPQAQERPAWRLIETTRRVYSQPESSTRGSWRECCGEMLHFSGCLNALINLKIYIFKCN